ncbi:major capsid protein [Chromobacterium violaceum]|uniref:major capsid protein n=1 Tax=Chromobacterium violaceum TaxID=536 RepID=UPI0035A57DAE
MKTALIARMKNLAPAVVLMTFAGAAMADGTSFDVSSVVTAILAIVAAVVSIGVAILSVTATIFGYKYLRRIM